MPALQASMSECLTVVPELDDAWRRERKKESLDASGGYHGPLAAVKGTRHEGGKQDQRSAPKRSEIGG